MLGDIFDYYLKQIINALAYLQEKHIVHRDLAARNFLVKYLDENKQDSGFKILVFAFLFY